MAEPVSLIWIKIIRGLVERRKSMGITQRQVERWLSLSHGHLSRWESHYCTPSVAHLIQWHQLLDMKILSIPLESRNRSRWPRKRATA